MTPTRLHALTPWLPCGRGRGWGWRRAAASSSGQRGRADRVQAVDQPGRQPLGAGQRDHGGVVGAVGQRRGGEGEAAAPSASASSAARTARVGRDPAGDHEASIARRMCAPRRASMARSRALGELAGDGGLDGGGEVAAVGLGRRAVSARRAAAVFRPENEKSQPSRPSRARGRGKRRGIAALGQPLQRRAAGIGAGPAPWRSCRTPRRRRRRWSSPAARQAPTPATSSSWQWPPETSSSRNG